MPSKVFAQALCQLIDSSPGSLPWKELNGSVVSEKSDRLMKAFLEFGSETDDNVNCSRHVEYGRVDDRVCGPNPVYGLKIKGKKILLADVMNIVESLELPSEVCERYPDLTGDEWSAITRMTTMILCAFEQDDGHVQRV